MTHGTAWPVVKALSPALLVIVPADILRLKWPGPGSRFARLYERLLGFLMRDSERVSRILAFLPGAILIIVINDYIEQLEWSDLVYLRRQFCIDGIPT